MSGTPDSRKRSAAMLARIVAPAVALTAVIGGTAWYANSGASLDLALDGQIQQIDSRASTVGDMLAAQSISLSTKDQVVPSADTPLKDGQRVEVRFARPLTVDIDGVTKTYTTHELTLGEALATLEVPIEGAKVSLPLDQELSRDGATVDITTPKSLTLAVGGKTSKVTSTGQTVSDVLAENKVALANQDKVAPAASTAITKGMTVSVTRIRTEKVTKTEKVAFETVKKNDSSLAKGKTKTLTKGVNGEREAVYSVTYTNGKTTEKELLSSSVTKKPVNAVVAVGTKSAPRPSTSSGSGSSKSSSGSGSSSGGGSAGGAASGLNWAALAKCESGGNPRAVNPAGYYGLYQFSLSTWRAVGGSGNPANASPAEQTRRAQILYNRAGVGQWPHCGPRLYS